MSKTVDILTAIRARLVAAGFTVFIGKVIDPKHDALPCVSLHFMQDGDQTQSVRPKVRRAVELVAEYWCRTNTTDPVLELIPKGELLESALIHPDDEGYDRVNGFAIQVEHIKTVLTAHEEYSDIGQAQVAIRVEYIRS